MTPCDTEEHSSSAIGPPALVLPPQRVSVQIPTDIGPHLASDMG